MRWENREDAQRYIKGEISDYYNQFMVKPVFQEGDRIQYSGTVFDDKELCAVVDTLFDFWLGAGRYAEKLEQDFAKWLGVRYCNLVNSGSSANLLAMKALTAKELGDKRICPGDEVITVACCFPTTVAPIIECGAIPVYVDVTLPQYNIDVTRLEEAFSERTKAVFIAHTQGNPFDLSSVKAFCDKHSLWLIEDNCDSLGAEYTIGSVTKHTGTWGDIGTSSFYPPHHMTMGEGGAVYTNNPVLNKVVKSLRDWGRDCMCPPGHDNFCGHRFDGKHGDLPLGYDHKYIYSRMGYNLKVTELQAAIGYEQFKKLPEFIHRRRQNWAFLRRALEPLSDKLLLPEPAKNSNPSWFGFLITVRPESGIERSKLVKAIEEKGIQTRMLFSGNILRQPCYDEMRGTDAYRVVGNLYNSDIVMNHTFLVGVYPGLTNEMLSYMANTIIKAVESLLGEK